MCQSKQVNGGNTSWRRSTSTVVNINQWRSTEIEDKSSQFESKRPPAPPPHHIHHHRHHQQISPIQFASSSPLSLPSLVKGQSTKVNIIIITATVSFLINLWSSMLVGSPLFLLFLLYLLFVSLLCFDDVVQFLILVDNSHAPSLLHCCFEARFGSIGHWVTPGHKVQFFFSLLFSSLLFSSFLFFFSLFSSPLFSSLLFSFYILVFKAPNDPNQSRRCAGVIDDVT